MDPALLEQSTGNEFTVKIFPLNPGILSSPRTKIFNLLIIIFRYCGTYCVELLDCVAASWR